jgi:hypothetical protein
MKTRLLKQIGLLAVMATLYFPVMAQSPEGFSFQAVMRDASSVLKVNANIGLSIQLVQGSPQGTVVYEETHAATSNANGLVSIVIGEGTVVNGDFATIDWSDGPYFITTAADLDGGTDYTIQGTTQLLSVPYALHAKTAESVNETDPEFNASPAGNITSSDITNWNNKLETELDPVFGASPAANIATSDINNWNAKQDALVAGSGINITGNTISATGGGSGGGTLPTDFYLGQDTLGGIVFYIYRDGSGNQRGFIVSATEGSGEWQTSWTSTGAVRTWDGAFNTPLMTNSPIANFATGLGSGWFVPGLDELRLLWNQRHIANKGLNSAGYTLLSSSAAYWSSVEFGLNNARTLNFNTGEVTTINKGSVFAVRAIRAF